MTADRWKVVKGLFYRAIKLPPHAWADYLDLVSAGDEDLRREVASLLAEHRQSTESHGASHPSEAITEPLARVPSRRPSTDRAVLPEEPTDA